MLYPQNNPQDPDDGEGMTRPVLKFWRSQELPQRNDQEEESAEENQTDMVDS